MEQPSPPSSRPSRLRVIPISPSQNPHAKARSREGGRKEPSPRHDLPKVVATGAEHRKTIAQRVSAGLRPQKRTQPRQGRQNLSTHACGSRVATSPSDPPNRHLPALRQELTRVRFASGRRICDARMQMEQPSPPSSRLGGLAAFHFLVPSQPKGSGSKAAKPQSRKGDKRMRVNRKVPKGASLQDPC
jgi:hypothetical protein